MRVSPCLCPARPDVPRGPPDREMHAFGPGGGLHLPARISMAGLTWQARRLVLAPCHGCDHGDADVVDDPTGADAGPAQLAMGQGLVHVAVGVAAVPLAVKPKVVDAFAATEPL
ncbi:hypothetical protein GCM10022226_32640 [Sphaerisporangium flaviroseum]|uniref:Uncharacterized protein n=1 Tax=Sphaerisporangium flaviroseum TaxID=509199 RepID=A0ABP7I1R9_9ACTN